MGAERVETDLRQRECPPALHGLQFLQHQALPHALQLLADPHLARRQVDIVPPEAGGFPEAQTTASATEKSAPRRCAPAAARNACD